MGRFFFCVIWGAWIGASLAAPTTVPSEIGQLAGELSESVVDLIASAREENPSTSDLEVAMQALIKKYVDFEKIVSETYVDLTGNTEESETASKSYYESIDAILRSVFGDEEEEEDHDVTIDELEVAAKQISQKMVDLLPQLQLTPESLDELLAHGEVLFIIVTEVHEIIHPYRGEEEEEEEKVEEGDRKKRSADIFWATKGHHGHHQGHHHGHHHDQHHEHHHGHQHGQHRGHQHGHYSGHHHGHHNDVFWAVGHQKHHDNHGLHAQHFGHHHGEQYHGHEHHGQHHGQHHGHHNDVFWAAKAAAH